MRSFIFCFWKRKLFSPPVLSYFIKGNPKAQFLDVQEMTRLREAADPNALRPNLLTQVVWITLHLASHRAMWKSDSETHRIREGES
jgi:hypothetical protein